MRAKAEVISLSEFRRRGLCSASIDYNGCKVLCELKKDHPMRAGTNGAYLEHTGHASNVRVNFTADAFYVDATDFYKGVL